MNKKPKSLPKPKFIVKPRKPGKTIRQRLTFSGESITKQSQKDDCDINLIMARFVKTGVMEHQRIHGAEYGFASADSFNESMQIVAKGKTMFEELPSSIRTKFENDPAKFLDFVQDENNRDAMQEMGLAEKSQTGDSPFLQNQSLSGEAINEPSGTAKSGSDAPQPGMDQAGGEGG